MTESEYEEKLKEVPAHHTEAFLVYLMNNNVVVRDLENWLIIENCKYHTETNTHWTAFYKHSTYTPSNTNIGQLFNAIPEGWAVFVKPEDKRSIRRYHVHIKPM